MQVLMTNKGKYKGVDLFCGCGGLTEGLKMAGINAEFAIDNDPYAIQAYKLNHPRVKTILGDIRTLEGSTISNYIGHKIHLLAGCPPCQGFSSLRRLNKNRSSKDQRNSLINEFLRLVVELRPYTIMLENVPWITKYYQFSKMITELKSAGYYLSYEIVNISDYGVAQSRERFVLLGSLFGPIKVARPKVRRRTVRSAIGSLESPSISSDLLHKILPEHSKRIKKMISLIPKDGGSRKDLPESFILNCHKRANIGFHDIYGRLKWDSLSATITGGCLNPSKGRFLHPEEDRVITPREAALLQSFPKRYNFPLNIPKASIALMIGNALPPKFSFYQARAIKAHLDQYLNSV